MRLLVTGAGGFLGSAVVHAALERGWQVFALSRRADPPRLAKLPIRPAIIVGDLADPDGPQRLVERVRPDAIVHTAWWGLDAASRVSPSQIELNLLPTVRLIEASIAAGVNSFVGIGSQAEYGNKGGHIDEAVLPEPKTAYGAAKLAAFHLGQALAASSAMRFAWLRLFATYGPGDNGSWLIPSVISQLARHERLALTPGTQRWDYLYIDDAARGILATIASEDACGVFNLASGEAVTVRSIVERIRDLVAPGLQLDFGQRPFAPDQLMLLEGDVARLRATGWAPEVRLEDGLARTVAASS